MSLADELAYMSAAEMAMRIRRRDFSPVEIVDALIGRIETRNPSLNAFVFKGFDDARSAAKEAERALSSGIECRGQFGERQYAGRLREGTPTPAILQLWRNK